MLEERWAADDDTPEDDDFPPEDDGLAPCPYCGEDMLEDAPQCPACGHYISQEDLPPQKKPPWIVLGVVVCLIIALIWAAGG